jgi:hypothetical protein
MMMGYTEKPESNTGNLWTLFSILSANGLALNLEKCVLAVAELDFLDTASPLPVSPPLGQRSGHF